MKSRSQEKTRPLKNKTNNMDIEFDNGALDLLFEETSYEYIREKLPNTKMMRKCLENHLNLFIPPKNDFSYKQGVNYFLKEKKFLSMDEIEPIE